jgi:hypothetical protein
MSATSANIPPYNSTAGEDQPFKPTEKSLKTTDGKDDDARIEWTVKVCPNGHQIIRQVRCGDEPWELCGRDWRPEEVIWPTWPARLADESALSKATASPLDDIQKYWTTAGDRLRDSAKWMATVLGAALATLIGTSPLAVVRDHRPQGIAVTLGLIGLLFLGATMFLVLQVMRPRSVSYSDIQNAKGRSFFLPRDPLYKWQRTVEREQDLYLPPGIARLTQMRQSMIIEEITLMALADARASARDHETTRKLCDAQGAREARLSDLRVAAARIATIGEYYKLRERSTWATYCGVLLGLLGTAAVVAAFAWPPS